MIQVLFARRYAILCFILALLACFLAVRFLNDRVFSSWYTREIYNTVDDSITEDDIIINTKGEAVGSDTIDQVGDEGIVDFSTRLKKGDSMQSVLRGAGLDAKQAHFVAVAINKVYSLNKLAPNQSVRISYLRDPENSLIYSINIELDDADLRIVLDGASYKAQLSKPVLADHIVVIDGIVDGSLYNTASRMEMHNDAFSKLLGLFRHILDLQREVNAGSRLRVIYAISKDSKGKVQKVRDIIYAELKSHNKSIEIYRYEAAGAGNHLYFHNTGHSIQKPFLKTPIKGAIISSGFGMRKHPILRYSRMHKGLDYAAKRGTPILASADGTIKVMSRSRSFGNYIKITHNNRYSTLYAHMERFVSGRSVGSRVKQGEIIGFVGSTGHSTNPHLHYEVHCNGVHINPAKANKVKDEFVLSGKNMDNFRRYVASIKSVVDGGLLTGSHVPYGEFVNLLKSV